MLEKTYAPNDIEARIAAAWEREGAFRAGRPERAGAEAYCIVIPPPNVTGSLHMGHALNNTLQDVLCRYQRLNGKDVLWQPGIDHAGIATQMVVERKLAQENRTDRRTMGREAFLKEVWAWKEQSGGTIVNQLKRLGASCDWSRERFTMDEGLSRAVLKVFVDLHRQGLVYKDKRLVNWDPKLLTAISDLEVIQVEKEGSFKWERASGEPIDLERLEKVLDRDPSGHLYYFDYPLADDPGVVVTVATTRPETMLGDTAVAVHPEDERWKPFIGKKVRLPLVGRLIPIVADDYSDPEKGSGAVKITPGHDFNDFEVGRRHGLKAISVLDAEARLSLAGNADFLEGAGEDLAGAVLELDGQDRFAARKRVIAMMAGRGLLRAVEITAHTVPHGDRGGVPVEPFLTEQWYVNAAELAKAPMAAVREGRTTFVPKNWEKTFFEWMENIQPWCVSRQLWWGHQIPAWYGFGDKQLESEFETARSDPEATTYVSLDPLTRKDNAFAGTEKRWLACEVAFNPAVGAFAAKLDELRAKHADLSIQMIEVADSFAARAAIRNAARQGKKIYPVWRDPDVLDTWFSSALWPFSTLGWPDETPEVKRYYQTDVLVTGFDIIFFWVARMMMMGESFMKETPFHTVYIHALVRDASGAKMSKSKGNVIDPLDLIDRYGADALRFTLAAMAAQGRDIKLSTQRVEGYRNFATKLWNAARFCEVNECRRLAGFDPAAVTSPLARWIVGETAKAAAEIEAGIAGYRFNEAAGAAYRFIWNVFCDWFLEFAKPILAGEDAAAKAEIRAVAAWTLDQTLVLLHPFMPFITEELWAVTGEAGPERQSLLALAAWPTLAGLVDPAAEAEIGWLVDLIGEIRSVRAEMNVAPSALAPLALVAPSAENQARATRYRDLLMRMGRLSDVVVAEAPPPGSVQIVVRGETAALPLAGLIDIAAERTRLSRALKEAQSDIARCDAKLDNPQFIARAEEEVIEEQREKREDAIGRRDKTRAALDRLETVG